MARTSIVARGVLVMLALVIVLAVSVVAYAGLPSAPKNRTLTGSLPLVKTLEDEFYSTMYVPDSTHAWRYDVVFLHASEKLSVTDNGKATRLSANDSRLERLQGRAARVRCRSGGWDEQSTVLDITVLDREPPEQLGRQAAPAVPTSASSEAWTSRGSLEFNGAGNGRYWARVTEQSFRLGRRTRMTMQWAVVDDSTIIVDDAGRPIAAAVLAADDAGKYLFTDADLELKGDVVHVKRMVLEQGPPEEWPGF